MKCILNLKTEILYTIKAVKCTEHTGLVHTERTVQWGKTQNVEIRFLTVELRF